MAEGKAGGGHSVLLENRGLAAVTGVVSVRYCNEREVSLDTVMGELVLGGKALQVSELSVDTGQVRVEGEIVFMQYTGQKGKSEGFFKGLFR